MKEDWEAHLWRDTMRWLGALLILLLMIYLAVYYSQISKTACSRLFVDPSKCITILEDPMSGGDR